ncbi:hypothetical protein FRC05_004217 [Tulasnella sp. 425]|nr:hypothetical protein FRC05_004217 [Tulasnella sp. 425]
MTDNTVITVNPPSHPRDYTPVITGEENPVVFVPYTSSTSAFYSAPKPPSSSTTDETMSIFKRLSATVSRRAKRAMPDALTVARETLKLAQAAQLPICAPAINIALEILNILQTVKEAALASSELLQTMHVYDETIANMIEIMSPEYLENSDDVQARIARKSIADFERTMESIKEVLDKANGLRTWKKALNNTELKAEIEGSTRQFVNAREKFNSSTLLVILANTCTSSAQVAEVDEFRIPGAPRRYQTWPKITTVGGSKKLAKLYTQKDGGEEAFLRDIRGLSQNL